jgi:phi13 family phage major tail protein
MANKIKYGLKNVYYAVATIAANGSATYDTPVAVPGAVSLSLDPQGDNTPFYADNIAYYVSIANSGYEGDLEMALFPDTFSKDVFGEIEDTKGVLIEDANASPVHFALLFQFEGDVTATKHVLYNCTAQRNTVGSTTKSDTVEPQTESATITATSIYVAALDKDIVKASTGDSVDSTTYSGWNTAVYVPSTVGE